jgi:hypothetical protein
MVGLVYKSNNCVFLLSTNNSSAVYNKICGLPGWVIYFLLIRRKHITHPGNLKFIVSVAKLFNGCFFKNQFQIKGPMQSGFFWIPRPSRGMTRLGCNSSIKEFMVLLAQWLCQQIYYKSKGESL